MSGVIIILLVATGIELPLAGFSLWYFLTLIARGLFCLRAMGIVIKMKTCMGIEIAGFILALLWHFTITKGHVPYGRLGFYALFMVVSFGCQLYDNIMYVYETRDVKE